MSAAAAVYWAALRFTSLPIRGRYALGCALLLAVASAGAATFARHYAVTATIGVEVDGNLSSSGPAIASAVPEWTPASTAREIDGAARRNLVLLAVSFLGLSLVTARSLVVLWTLRISTMKAALALPTAWEARARSNAMIPDLHENGPPMSRHRGN